ncbi:hypothetical protein PHYBLDRAFT_149699 [Phycomyces blakesleeanus NRRL 1555(-)]|uniref:Uncharacterized protein n=1 Tax=Phycomyces blakesleeanus (strain ATCC 8743b / DSM 1359 / FGSC 10004 / NBRC 33097 / NRRL 1555) TaxID=763407 RepID=A0A162ZVL8_PHYB8|nr:hypothetical protein PHYBLDRAFT_149699 [Phycomyces blakesleeanus NRRL 1555(-)]OAD69301.1 hypothetical protein PHYBLDRAFT_149699 [Phycomyces blakesleeanus NRRL 1555(-)]|eukprot:XP_018287341.1 hypothetical protein PHYBLDRAFT_149699 [Phycomyces blakesleeanus NRRL 1555(-)]
MYPPDIPEPKEVSLASALSSEFAKESVRSSIFNNNNINNRPLSSYFACIVPWWNTSHHNKQDNTEKLAWCYRPLNHSKSVGYRPFKQKNQCILWEHALRMEQVDSAEQEECHVWERDKNGVKRDIRVIIEEQVGFVADPYRTQPLVYEVSVCSMVKMSWRQRLIQAQAKKLR